MEERRSWERLPWHSVRSVFTMSCAGYWHLRLVAWDVRQPCSSTIACSLCARHCSDTHVFPFPASARPGPNRLLIPPSFRSIPSFCPSACAFPVPPPVQPSCCSPRLLCHPLCPHGHRPLLCVWPCRARWRPHPTRCGPLCFSVHRGHGRPPGRGGWHHGRDKCPRAVASSRFPRRAGGGGRVGHCGGVHHGGGAQRDPRGRHWCVVRG